MDYASILINHMLNARKSNRSMPSEGTQRAERAATEHYLLAMRDPTPDHCNECGVEMETKSGETTIGGDLNSNGNLSGTADVPCVVWCDNGHAYLEDERVPEYDEVYS